MSHNPYHFTTTQRHGFGDGAPGAGDFDQPGYLTASPGEYGFLPAALAAIPLWAWLTGGAAVAAGTGGAYLYGQNTGASNAATLAAATQANAAPPTTPTTPYAPAPYAPPAAAGTAPPSGSTALTDQPWFWPALITTAGLLAFAAFRPRR